MELVGIDRGETLPENASEETKPIVLVLILIGLPGSGKSTFCDEVMKISSRPWVRVCQDTIKNGKAGTKDQCLSSAASALKEGKSVLIDRCNINTEQRADFLKLGGLHTRKHAVVLDLPVKLCVSRSVRRTGHEGNLQGGRAAAVVNQMQRQKEIPKLSEGFNRITICENEKDVKESINVYGSLGPMDSLQDGCFGRKDPKVKFQVGIMKFFKTAETSVNAAISAENIPTLAFPSISTADFQFDLEKASDVIVEKVEEFVSQIGNARLMLIDLSQESKILSLVKNKAAKKNIDPSKFFTFAEDITRLHSRGGLQCNVIANAANSRLAPGGGGVNAAIFRAAGSTFEVETKKRAKYLLPGKSVIAPVPTSSPLFTREGITHIIHVLGPNMNPKRPDCLNGDYVEGCKILREAYTALFEGFVSIVESKESVSRSNFEGSLESGYKPDEIPMPEDHIIKSKDECESDFEGSLESGYLPDEIPAPEDQILKRKAECESDNSKKYKGSEEDLNSTFSISGNEEDIKKGKFNTTKAWGSWSLALYKIAMQPEKHESGLLEVSDHYVVMNDAYPKAKRHLLVLGRTDGLDCIGDVRREHISILRTMHDIGLRWAKKYLEEDNSLLFRLGYHSVPSMRQLHLHVISQDFYSPHLKNKKHWNSFNTPFFLDSVNVLKELQVAGSVTPKEDIDKYLKKELRCHRCESLHPRIPNLKSHISSCKYPFPAALFQNGCLVSAEST